MDVAFAIGSLPRLSADDARDVADLLSGQRSVAAHRLAEKIRSASGEPIELDADELAVLVAELDAVLAEPGWAEERPAFVHLRDELARHRGI